MGPYTIRKNRRCTKKDWGLYTKVYPIFLQTLLSTFYILTIIDHSNGK